MNQHEPTNISGTYLVPHRNEVSMMVLETWLIPLVSLLSGGMNGSTDVARSASILRIARVMRVLRTARVAKLARYMPELIILLKGMMIAFRSVSLVLDMLYFSMFLLIVSRRGLAE